MTMSEERSLLMSGLPWDRGGQRLDATPIAELSIILVQSSGQRIRPAGCYSCRQKSAFQAVCLIDIDRNRDLSKPRGIKRQGE